MVSSYNVGDVVTPAIDYETQGYTFPTSTASGTVIQREVATYAVDEEETTYTYRVQFPTAIIGEDNQGDTISQTSFWFSHVDLGLEDPNQFDILIDPEAARQSVSAAQTATSTALQVSTDAYNGMGNSPLRDTVRHTQGLLESMNTVMQNKSVTGETIDDEQTSAHNANVTSESVGNDAVIMQEMTENISQIQAVVDEIKSEMVQNSEQGLAQSKAAWDATEQDYVMFMNTFVAPDTTPQSIVSIADEIKKLDSAYVAPEVEQEIKTWDLNK